MQGPTTRRSNAPVAVAVEVKVVTVEGKFSERFQGFGGRVGVLLVEKC